MPEAKTKAEVDRSNEENTIKASIEQRYDAEKISSGGNGPDASHSSIYPDHNVVSEDELDELSNLNPS